MKTKTHVKAGKMSLNHNQAQLVMRTTTDDETDYPIVNHNETQLRSRSLRVKTGVKAGPIIRNEGPGGSY